MKLEKLKPLTVREKLLEKNIIIFTPRDFSRLFPVNLTKIKYFLETYTKQGLFVRLKRGLYTLKDKSPTEGEIANALYKPSYISFEYALAKHGIIPEMVYMVTSATTKPTRDFTVNNTSFFYFTIKKQAFTGYSLQDARLLADPEKAFVDYMYFVSLGKKKRNDRMNLSQLNKKKIFFYAKLFDCSKLIDILKSYDYK